jgi:hypothetical protein
VRIFGVAWALLAVTNSSENSILPRTSVNKGERGVRAGAEGLHLLTRLPSAPDHALPACIVVPPRRCGCEGSAPVPLPPPDTLAPLRTSAQPGLSQCAQRPRAERRAPPGSAAHLGCAPRATPLPPAGSAGRAAWSGHRSSLGPQLHPFSSASFRAWLCVRCLSSLSAASESVPRLRCHPRNRARSLWRRASVSSSMICMSFALRTPHAVAERTPRTWSARSDGGWPARRSARSAGPQALATRRRVGVSACEVVTVSVALDGAMLHASSFRVRIV